MVFNQKLIGKDNEHFQVVVVAAVVVKLFENYEHRSIKLTSFVKHIECGLHTLIRKILPTHFNADNNGQ